MLRKRDVVAVIFAVILSQIAWNRQELLAASVHLSFYLTHPIHGAGNTLKPAILDLDGDELPDTLVHILMEKNDVWQIQVADIQTDHSPHPPGTPFQPPIVLESDFITAKDIHPKAVPDFAAPVAPLRMTVGHVILKGGRGPISTSKSSQNKDPNGPNSDITDRNRKMFCGVDWHHAAKCRQPCPSGSSSECPEGERCFADTPCDYLEYQQRHGGGSPADGSTTTDVTIEMESLLTDMRNVSRTYHLSPAGGLPSVVTLWSTGLVTLHGLTAARSKSSRANPTDDPLQIELLWKTSVLPAGFTVLDWLDSSVSFIDEIDAGNGNGLIVVTGTVEGYSSDTFEEDDEEIGSTLVATINARTGKIAWRSFWQDRDNGVDKPAVVLPAFRGVTSSARRRSRIPNLHHHSLGDAVAANPQPQNCLQSSFRRALLTSSSLVTPGALPTSYWTEDDSNARILHFDLEQPKAHQHTKDKNTKKSRVPRKRKRRHKGAARGKPNVLVTHNMEGLQVRSLKNGRSLCHLGLAEEALYADINHDGTLDSIQMALGTHSVRDKVQDEGDTPIGYEADDDLRFVSELARKMSKHQQDRKQGSSSSDADSDENDYSTGDNLEASLCHLMVLSGFPSREELFSVNLCGGKYRQVHPNSNIVGATPLLVEPRDSGRKGYDIIAAVNTGLVHRLHGRTGRKLWQLVGKHHQGNIFPHWDNPERVLLSRVDAPNVAVPALRPIILAGEDGLALLSSQSGQIMASAQFPQQSTQRPMLVDFNGDGTTDLVVQSKDGIWGFEIHVVTGSSLFLRIMVGLLFMSLLLAVLSNRFGPRPGKRSTDL